MNIEQKVAASIEELAAAIESVCRMAAARGPEVRVAIGDLRMTDNRFKRDYVLLTDPNEGPPEGQRWTVHGPWTAGMIAEADRIIGRQNAVRANLGHSISTGTAR